MKKFRSALALLLVMIMAFSCACAEPVVLEEYDLTVESGVPGMGEVVEVMEFTVEEAPAVEGVVPVVEPTMPEVPAMPEAPVEDAQPGAVVKDDVSIEVSVSGAAYEAYAPLRANGAYVNTSTGKVGQTIYWGVTATGGNGDYAYLFNIFCGNTVLRYGSWQLSNTVSWTPTYPGNYYVAAYVVDSTWTTIAGPATNGGMVSVTAATLPLSAHLTANTTTAQLNQPITWTLTPGGGNGDYAYFYNIFCGDEVVYYGNWQLDPSITWYPTKPGNYYVAGYVVDSRWVEIAQAPEGGLVPVNGTPLVGAGVTVSTYSTSVGYPITWNTGATGGTGIYSYSFFVYYGNQLCYDSGWQTSNSFTYYPPAAGAYYVVVYITDSSWTQTISVSSTAVTQVYSNTPLTVTGYGTRYPDVYQTSVYYYAEASGGTPPYIYDFVMYEYSYTDSYGVDHYSYSWETDWQVEDYVSVNFYAECDFILEMNVMDSAGNTTYYDYYIYCY